MAYVYVHKKKSNDSIFYVGIGSDSDGKYVRANVVHGRNRNTHWQNVVNKHGYYIEITHDNIIWEEACSIEKYLIVFYGRKDLQTGILVNKTDGGEGVIGTIMTDAKRKKMSESKKGENHPMYGKKQKQSTIDKIRTANTGKIHDEKWLSNISNALKGRNPPNKGKRMPHNQYLQMIERIQGIKQPVLMYTLDGNLLNKYDSVINAARNNMLTQGNITNAANKKIMYGGYLWRYVDDNNAFISIEPYNVRIKPVLKCTMDGDVLEEYKSAMDAANKNNFQKSSILRVCNGKYKQAYGYKWLFKKIE